MNQRFPVYYSEKRPFFMEGMGTFELAGAGGDSNMRTAVNTRVIVDPLWGGKSTGTAGKASFALLAAGDEAPGAQALGEPAEPVPRRAEEVLRRPRPVEPRPRQLRGRDPDRHRFRQTGGTAWPAPTCR